MIITLAAKKEISHSVAEQIILEIFGSMEEVLISGGRIEIRGFGSFENRVYDGYEGRNPKTGEVVVVKPKKTPFFKVGKNLKERIFGMDTSKRNDLRTTIP
jgi:integration host factor subunit beta